MNFINVYENIKVEFNKKNNISFSFVNFLINIVLFLIMVGIINFNSTSWITGFGYIYILQLINNCLFLILCGYSIISLPFLFSIFTVLFHVSHFLLIAFNIGAERAWDILVLVPNEKLILVAFFIFIALTFLNFGILLSNSILSKTNHSIKNIVSIFNVSKIIEFKNNLGEEYIRKIIFKIAIIMLIIGIVPKLYIDINKLMLMLNGSYLDTYTLNIPGFIYTIGLFSEFAIILLLISKQDNKFLCRIIIFIVLMYQFFSIFCGHRGRPVVFSITLFSLYFMVVEKLTMKSIIILIFSGITGLFTINFISDFRIIQNRNFENIFNAFINNLIESPIFNIMGEFGNTLITLCYTVMHTPLYGELTLSHYMNGFATIVPNIGGIINGNVEKSVFLNYLPKQVTAFLGGSYLGEAYFSFGIYSVILVFIFGIGIGLIGNIINKSIKEKKWIILSIGFIFMPSLLWWNRGYFADGIREIIWSILIIFILFYIIFIIDKKLNKIEGVN